MLFWWTGPAVKAMQRPGWQRPSRTARGAMYAPHPSTLSKQKPCVLLDSRSRPCLAPLALRLRFTPTMLSNESTPTHSQRVPDVCQSRSRTRPAENRAPARLRALRSPTPVPASSRILSCFPERPLPPAPSCRTRRWAAAAQKLPAHRKRPRHARHNPSWMPEEQLCGARVHHGQLCRPLRESRTPHN